MQTVKELIEKRAYELFLKRGAQDGYHIQDWIRAEQEVMAELEKKPASESSQTTKKQPAKTTAPKAATKSKAEKETSESKTEKEEKPAAAATKTKTTRPRAASAKKKAAKKK
ncbi:hypothetical protein CHISP_2851 [Chitinispirillum alkaliphilum]|nr:hypothetical protein CHISP_2851 [Chitinispirillum alkaliphilum]